MSSSISLHIAGLRSLCFGDHTGVAPYLLRTRFERHMFGLTGPLVASRLGRSLQSLDEEYLRDLVEVSNAPWTDQERRLVTSVAQVFRRFTYLCDTSNWSDDGQDVRVKLCRRDILAICDLAESIEDSAPA